MTSIASLVQTYEDGDMATGEFSSKLILAAAEHLPEAIAVHLSAEYLAIIRERTTNPPGSPDQVVIVRIGAYTGTGHLERDQQEQIAYFHGAWAWHAYFRRLDAAVFA
jgi:hypothetical protein